MGHHFYIVIAGEVEVRVPAPVELEEESATPEGLMSFIITYFQDINWKVTDMAQTILLLFYNELDRLYIKIDQFGKFDQRRVLKIFD